MCWLSCDCCDWLWQHTEMYLNQVFTQEYLKKKKKEKKHNIAWFVFASHATYSYFLVIPLSIFDVFCSLLTISLHRQSVQCRFTCSLYGLFMTKQQMEFWKKSQSLGCQRCQVKCYYIVITFFLFCIVYNSLWYLEIL